MPHPVAPHSELVNAIYWLIDGLSILLAIAALVWGGAMVHAYRRDGRRQREGLCLKCGYDLRGATDHCPECGAPMRIARPDKFHPR